MARRRAEFLRPIDEDLHRRFARPPQQAPHRDTLAVLAGESRLVIALERSTIWLVDLTRRAQCARILAEAAQLAPPARVRLAGLTVISAVVAHAVVLAIAGVHVQTAGWSWRGGAALVGLMALFRPRR